MADETFRLALQYVTTYTTRRRIAGAFYLLTILAGMFAQGFVSERLVVSGNAAATAANILAHEPLFRLGFAVYRSCRRCRSSSSR